MKFIFKSILILKISNITISEFKQSLEKKYYNLKYFKNNGLEFPYPKSF